MLADWADDGDSEDVMDQDDTGSTEDLAHQENQDAARADENRGYADQRDRMEEGRSHDRSLGDRSGRESSS